MLFRENQSQEIIPHNPQFWNNTCHPRKNEFFGHCSLSHRYHKSSSHVTIHYQHPTHLINITNAIEVSIPQLPLAITSTKISDMLCIILLEFQLSLRVKFVQQGCIMLDSHLIVKLPGIRIKLLYSVSSFVEIILHLCSCPELLWQACPHFISVYFKVSKLVVIVQILSSHDRILAQLRKGIFISLYVYSNKNNLHNIMKAKFI